MVKSLANSRSIRSRSHTIAVSPRKHILYPSVWHRCCTPAARLGPSLPNALECPSQRNGLQFGSGCAYQNGCLARLAYKPMTRDWPKFEPHFLSSITRSGPSASSQIRPFNQAWQDKQNLCGNTKANFTSPAMPSRGKFDMEFAQIGAVKSKGAADYLVQRLIKPDSWAPIPHQ